MSRPRSGSPRYRSFPWDEPGFDTHKLVAELDGDHHMDRKHRPRLEHPEGSWDCFREDSYPEGPQRRSPIYQEDRRSNHEEAYHRRASPIQDLMGYNDDGRRHQRLSPVFDGAGDSPRHRGGFKDHFQSFESRGRSPHSPPRLMRERLPQTPRPDPDHRMGWKRDDQGRGRGRFREFQSPNARSSEEQRVGAGRERDRRTAQSPNRDRRRDDSLQQQERNQPPFKRQRREMDDADNMGFRNEDHLREQRYSVGSPREGFGGADRCSVPRGDSRHRIGPLVVEHDHGNAGEPEPPRWDQFEDRGDLDPVFDRQRSPRPMASSSSQERFRAQDNRLDDREDSRGRHFQGDWKKPNLNEPRRSATPQERPNPMRFGNRGDGVNHRGRGGPNQARGQASRGRGARNEPPRNQPRIQHSAQIYQDPSREEPRQGQAYRPYRENSYEDPVEAEPDWAEEDDRQQWKQQDRPGSLERHLPRLNPDPKMPRQRERQWNDPKSNNNMNEMEETLTIKVDMSRPANQNSSLAYSSDRQLSLDLVNVGRQRLDFLPMLEHSGTYRESATHTGTFAQEIITLVHFVKDQYFRDGGVSLNERFSAPQKSGFAEDEAEELTLDERFTSNRGFSLEMDSLFDDDEPLFSGMEPMQPVRGPGDLRHDLERRKQERLEGVRVTISGNSSSQRPLAPLSPAGLDYDDINEMSQMEDEGFSNWPEEQSSSRRREGNMGQRRGGAPYSTGPHGRNNRFGNRLGPVRRQNNRGNPQEPARYAPCHPPCEPAQYPILPSSSAKGPLQGGRNPLNPDERKRRLAEGLCIYCGEPGHHMAKCPLRPGGRKPLTPDERKRRLTEGLCIYCGEPGHHMAKCPLRPNK